MFKDDRSMMKYYVSMMDKSSSPDSLYETLRVVLASVRNAINLSVNVLGPESARTCLIIAFERGNEWGENPVTPGAYVVGDSHLHCLRMLDTGNAIPHVAAVSELNDDHTALVILVSSGPLECGAIYKVETTPEGSRILDAPEEAWHGLLYEREVFQPREDLIKFWLDEARSAKEKI